MSPDSTKLDLSPLRYLWQSDDCVCLVGGGKEQINASPALGLIGVQRLSSQPSLG